MGKVSECSLALMVAPEAPSDGPGYALFATLACEGLLGESDEFPNAA